MKLHVINCALAAAALFAAGAGAATAQDFAVIISEQNSYSGNSGDTIEQLRRLYLKEQSDWPGGAEAIPFARAAGTPEQEAFLAEIGMTSLEEQAHWLRMKQIRGETEPRAVGSTRILARQVARNAGAFAVVEYNEVEEMPGVRVLHVFGGS